MEAIILCSTAKQLVASMTGMQPTVNTSALFAYRCLNAVPRTIEAVMTAINSTDFEQFTAPTMRDSNKSCTACLDTTILIFYRNGVSRATIRTMEALNVLDGRVVGAYTFDPGPNEGFGYPEKDEEIVLGFLGVFLSPEVAEWDRMYEKGCAGGL